MHYFLANILQISMIPHNLTLFQYMCALYQNQHQTLPIKKIDRGQIGLREYHSTLSEPKVLARLTLKFFFFVNGFLKVFRTRRYMTQCAFINISWKSESTKSLRDSKMRHKMPFLDPMMWYVPNFHNNQKKFI